MSQLDHTLIGHLIDVQGSVLISTLLDDEQGWVPTITIGSDDVLIGRIGSYVSIRQSNLNIIAVVTRMSEQELLTPPVIEIPGEEAARLPYAKRILRLSPVGTIAEDGSFERGIGEYPTTGAGVHAVGPQDIAKMFSKFRSKGYSPGKLTASSMEVYLDPSNLFGRHVAILGQTGSGKSWTVATLIQRALDVMPNAHILILDMHGEYCWKSEDDDLQYSFEPRATNYVDARDLEIPYWLMTFADLCDLLIEHGEREATNQTAFFRDCLLEGRIKENDSAHLNLERVTVDTPIYFSLDDLIKKVTAKNTERGTRQGPMFGNFDRFLMRLESKLNDSRYDFLLKPVRLTTSDSLSDLLRDFIGLGEPSTPVNVLDLSYIPYDVRPTVAAQIGRLLFEFNYWNPSRTEFPILLFCEEAHSYIPRAVGSRYEGSRKSMERIAKEGRKYGVGLAIVSQRPHEVSETVLSQCGTFICLRITNPDDQRYVRGLVPENEGDLVDILAGLARGEALVLGEAVPLPTRMKLDLPIPEPNSSDVDFYCQWKRDSSDLDVDKIVANWRNQTR